MGLHRPGTQHEDITAVLAAVFPHKHTDSSSVLAADNEDPDSHHRQTGGDHPNDTNPDKEYYHPRKAKAATPESRTAKQEDQA